METILVLTDFSDSATNAARYAAAFSRQFAAAKILLYHSYSIAPVVTTVPMPTHSAIIGLHDASIKKLTELKTLITPMVKEKTEIEVLTNDKPIITAVYSIAQLYELVLTVVGVTGKSSFERTLIGSNTLSLVEESISPLLLIPPQAVFVKIRKVVFASDLKDVYKTSPVAAIKEVIHKLDANLYLLNVANGESGNSRMDAVIEQKDLHKLWDSENAEYHFINNKDIAEGIMEFVSEEDVQLLIVVPKKRGFFESIFHRSLTKKLAYHTDLPLLIFKEEE